MPLRHGIAVGARVLHRLDQLGDDMRRRRAVGVAHAEVDDVLCRCPCLGLGRVHLGEDVGRQAADAVEFLGHRLGPCGWADALPDGGSAAAGIEPYRGRSQRPGAASGRRRAGSAAGGGARRRAARRGGGGGRLARGVSRQRRAAAARRRRAARRRAGRAGRGWAGGSAQVSGRAPRPGRRGCGGAAGIGGSRRRRAPAAAGAGAGDAAQQPAGRATGGGPRPGRRSPLRGIRGDGRSGRGGTLARLGRGGPCRAAAGGRHRRRRRSRS